MFGYVNRDGTEIGPIEHALMCEDRRYCYVAGTLITGPDDQAIYHVVSVFRGEPFAPAYDVFVNDGDGFEHAGSSCNEESARGLHEATVRNMSGRVDSVFRLREITADQLDEPLVPYRPGITIDEFERVARAGTPTVIET